MRLFTRMTYSSSKRRGLPEWADRDAPDALAAWVIGILIFMLVVLTGVAFFADVFTGIGFGLTAMGMMLTLVTRKRGGDLVWFLSVLLGVAGLAVVLLSIPSLCKDECSVEFVNWFFAPLKLPMLPRG